MKKWWLLIGLSVIFSLFSQSQKKNVLIIMVDDLNDMGNTFAMPGYVKAITPNIDKLATKGIVFQRGYCSAPVCNPSRTSIFTGLRPKNTAIFNNADGDFRDLPATKDLVTLQGYFMANGYESVGTGKIFHNGAKDHAVGPSFHKYGQEGGGGNGGTVVVQKVINGELDYKYFNNTPENTADFRNAQYGADYLKQNHTKPFILSVGIFRPHEPFGCPKSFYDMYANVLFPNPPVPYKANDLADCVKGGNDMLHDVNVKANWTEIVKTYLANTTFADYCIGHLLEGLYNSPYKDNTIVVLAGDHGWHLGEKDHFEKYTLWDRAIRTSFIIYDPTLKKTGHCMKMASLQDIFPTLVDLTGLPKNNKIAGRTLKPLLMRPDTSCWDGVALTTYAAANNNSIRTDRYRYTNWAGKEELYDHYTDPNEWTNLAGNTNYAQTKSDLKSLLDKMTAGNEQPADCPSISITAPSNNSTIASGSNFTINTQTSISTSLVRFYDNSNLLSETKTSPFVFKYINPSFGIHNLKAQAETHSGIVAISNNIKVTVSNVTEIEEVDYEDHSFIYPNPTQEYFLLANNGKIESLNIFDINGDLIYQSYQISELTTGFGKELPKGIFMAQVKMKDGNLFTFKLTKE